MTSIDERIVAMSFENRVFEANVARTMTTLGKLDATLQKVGSASGFAEIDKAASKVTLSGPMSALDKLKARIFGVGEGAADGFSLIERASSKISLSGIGTAIDKTQAKLHQLSAGTTFTDIEHASEKVSFSALTKSIQAAGDSFTFLEHMAANALGGIGTNLMMKTSSWAKGFTFGPIIDGLHEYETNLKSIQVIQANTDRPLPEIEKSLQELNRYSDQTIYNFSEMAKNIGTFTAAGVDLKTATSSIKGIANMAALSGSSSQQAATAMYQLSQAISSGRVGLQDWNSVVNAGMGGKKLQTALATTATAMGQIGKETFKLEGPMKKVTINGQSFRESIMAKPGQESWLSSEVLVNTLASLDGRFSKAALAAEKTETGLRKYTDAQIEAMMAESRANLEKKNGVKYTDEQFKALQKLSTSAFKSATEVKTLGQVFDVAKETIASGWSASFKNIFGTLKEAKKTFTEMSGTINDFINAGALARNTLLNDWNKLGGRTEMIEGIKQAFQNLFAILKPVGQAFRDIFPRKTGQDLYDFTVSFRKLMGRLEPSEKTVENLRRTFRGFFAILSIGFTVIKKVGGVIADLLGFVGGNSGGFLELTGSIGDFLVEVDKAIKRGDNLGEIFEQLADKVQAPLNFVKDLGIAIGSLFSGDGVDLGNKMAGSLENVRIELSPLGKVVKAVSDAFNKFKTALSGVANFLEPIFSSAVQAVSSFGDMLTDAFEKINYDDVMAAFTAAFTGGILVTLRKAIGGGVEMKFFDNVKENVVGTLNAVTGSLNALQRNIQANTLLQIATALGVMALGVYALSKVDPDRLAPTMTAMAVGLGQLVGAFRLLGSVGLSGMAAMPVIAASMIMLAGALVILSGAVFLFSRMDWEDLQKGLVGVGGSLAAVGVGIKVIGPGILPVAAAMIPLAIGIGILAGAVKIFATLSWDDIQRGLVGVAGSLRAIAFGMKTMDPRAMLVLGPALILIATGLNILAASVALFGNMDFGTLVKGIVAIGAAMKVLAGGLLLMPTEGLVVMGAALILVAVALNGIATAVGIFGNLDILTLVKGIIAMGKALSVLAIGLKAMTGSAMGSVALLGAATALAILAPTLALMGNLKWGTLLKGLAAMALSLGVIAVVGVVAAPALMLMGGALSLLGLGIGAIAAGFYLFAKGLSLLASEGQKSVAVLLTALTGFVALIPTIAIEFIKGLLEIIKGIAEIAPEVMLALGILINSLVDLIIREAPKIGEGATALIQAFLGVIRDNAPDIIQTGFELLMNLLRGIDTHIQEVAARVNTIILKFVNQMADDAPRLTASGTRMLVSWLNGITKGIPKVIGAAAKMVTTFLNEVARHLPEFINAGANIMVEFLNGIAKELPRIIRAGARVIIAFLDGISKQFKPLADKATDVIVRFLRAISQEKNVKKIVAEGFKTLERFIRGIEKGLFESDAVKDLLDAFVDLGKRIGSSILKGLGKLRDEIMDRINPFFSQKELDQRDKAEQAALDKSHAERIKKYRDMLRADGKLTKEEMEKLARYAGQGYAKGIADEAIEMEKATRKAMRKSIKAAKDELEEKSPSRVFMEIGRNVVEGMSIGLQGMPGQLDKGIVGPLRTMLAQTKDTKKLGRFLGKAFADGLVGSKDDIQTAFDGLKGQLKSSQAELRQQIKEDQGKLKQLMQGGQDNDKAILDAQKQLSDRQKALGKAESQDEYDQIYEEVQQAQKDLNKLIKFGEKNDAKVKAAFRMVSDEKQLLEAATKATRQMMKDLEDEQKALITLADSYDVIVARLEEVQGFLEKTQEQYSQLPEFDVGLEAALADMDLTYAERAEKRREAEKEAEKRRRIDQVALYKKALEEQIRATQQYNKTLEDLRAKGLDDTTYKKLLDQGISGQDFASQLLQGGEKAIRELNALDAQLVSAADNLSQDAADQLFNAGKHAAEGIVAGLQAQAAEIKAIMGAIADDMVKQIKTKLKIKSPSQVFAEIGKFTGQGFVDGIQQTSKWVVDAASGVGDDAANAMADSLAKVSDTLNSEVDSNLTVTPVLDLSQVERDAKKMGGMIDNVTPIAAAASYGQATAISSETAETQAAQAETQSAAPILMFEQNNTSPEKLSEIEIYRQTSNQLAQAKAMLGLVS